jgi:hypothetical protein
MLSLENEFAGDTYMLGKVPSKLHYKNGKGCITLIRPLCVCVWVWSVTLGRVDDNWVLLVPTDFAIQLVKPSGLGTTVLSSLHLGTIEP